VSASPHTPPHPPFSSTSPPPLQFIVLASDGVWEFLTNMSVCEMVRSFTSPLDACRAVVSESYRLWLQFDERTDDITMILGFFDHDMSNAIPLDDADIDALTGGAEGVQIEAIRPVRRGLSKEKKKAMAIQASAAGAEEDLSDWVLQVVPKSEEDIQLIAKAVKANFLFQHLNEAQVKQVYDVMKRVTVKKGDVVIRQGDEGDWFYVVEDGELSVTIQAGDGPPMHILNYTTDGGKTNPCFGELALMYSKPRAATVTAETDGSLWAMDRRSFRAILMKSSSESLVKTLRSVKILSSLSVSQLQRLQDKLSEMSFKEGEFIITQGDTNSTSLYLLSDGRVSITRKEDMSDDRPAKQVMELGAGSYFGERALLHQEPRAANVIALTEVVKLLAVSKETFEEVLGPLQEIIDADRKEREEKAQKLQQLREAEGLADATVGDFSFDGVTVVDDLTQYALCSHTGRHNFTIKCMAKGQVLREGFGARVISETALASTIMEHHPTVPLIVSTLQDEDWLYTVLKARIAIEISILLGETPFEESTGQFYTASIASGLSHLHKHGIIYRNLTVDSLVIDQKGYVQLTDMKHAVRSQPMPTDFCGYPHYLSPEQVSGQGHGSAVDFWALGIVTYEMATGGGNPWLTGDPAKDGEVGVYSRISAHQLDGLVLPEGISLSDGHIQTLNDLLHPDPKERVGPATVRDTVWLSLFEWAQLEDCSLKAPHAREAREAVESAKAEGAKPDAGDAAGFNSRASSSAYTGFSDWGLSMEDLSVDNQAEVLATIKIDDIEVKD
jgi:CRP-like cAMP-binding protein